MHACRGPPRFPDAPLGAAFGAVHCITSQRASSHCVAMHGSSLPAHAKTRAGACETCAGACEMRAGTSPAGSIALHLMAPHRIESHHIASHRSAVHCITSQRAASHRVAMHRSRVPARFVACAGKRLPCIATQYDATRCGELMHIAAVRYNAMRFNAMRCHEGQ